MSVRIVDDIRLVQQFAIHVNVLIHDLDAIAWQTDDPLHKMLVFLIREFENDDVAALKRAIRQKFLIPGPGAPKNELVDQQMVANEQGAFHGGGGNFEGLNDKRGAEQSQDHSNEE